MENQKKSYTEKESKQHLKVDVFLLGPSLICQQLVRTINALPGIDGYIFQAQFWQTNESHIEQSIEFACALVLVCCDPTDLRRLHSPFVSSWLEKQNHSGFLILASENLQREFLLTRPESLSRHRVRWVSLDVSERVLQETLLAVTRESSQSDDSILKSSLRRLPESTSNPSNSEETLRPF